MARPISIRTDMQIGSISNEGDKIVHRTPTLPSNGHKNSKTGTTRQSLSLLEVSSEDAEFLCVTS